MGLFRTSDTLIGRAMPLTAANSGTPNSLPAWVFENQTGILGTNLNGSVVYCNVMPAAGAGTVSVILSGTSLASVATLTLLAGGSGYTTAVAAVTTCSNPNASGLTVDTTVVAGAITVIVVNAVGAGYNPGDIITVAAGGGDGTATINTVNRGTPAVGQALTFTGLQSGQILPVVIDYVTAVGGGAAVGDFTIGR